MNYLELCNEVLVRMREDEITDIADPDNEPQQKLVTRFVQDAYDFVLKAHNWNAQRKEWKIPIIEGQNIYELPVSSEGASVYSVELKDDCNKKGNMIEVDAPGMARLDECQTGVPYYYAPSRVSNGQLGLEIWPMPVIPKEPEPEPEPGGGGYGCPCSCGKFTFDPLPCGPGEITGGLYEMADTRPIADGVFLNSDGSQGRVQEWLKGEPSNLLPDVNGRAEVFYKNEKHYGFMDNNSGQGRAWSSGLKNYEGQAFNGKFEDTFEFCALIGHTGNQATNEPPLIDVPDKRTENFGRNGKVRFTTNLYLLKENGDTAISNGININCSVERSAPGSIRFSQNTSVGGSDHINIDVSPLILDPEDKYYWLSVKTTFGLESLGAATSVIPGYTNQAYWAYRSFAKSDIYINGSLIAQDVYTNYKSGYIPEDPRMYSEVNSGAIPAVEPQNLKLGTIQTKNGGVKQDTIPSIFIDKPNQGTNQVFIAFMDEGPGAADIPNTELGKNLKRIDPNHTPSEECDCPELPKPAGIERLAIISSDTKDGQYATVDGFLTNESGGPSTMPYNAYQSDYDNVKLGNTAGEEYGEIYEPYKGFRNHTYWSSANGQEITFTPPGGPGDFYGVLSSEDYPEDNERSEPTCSFDWEIAIYLDWEMTPNPSASDYIRLSPNHMGQAWWNSNNTSYTNTSRFNGAELHLNGNGEITWTKGTYALSESSPSIQLADRKQMTGWYIIRAKQDYGWRNVSSVYSEYYGTAEYEIEVPWGYTYRSTVNEPGYQSGTGITKYMRTGREWSAGPGANVYTIGGTGWRIPFGAAIYADKTKGETIPRDVLDWYIAQREDYEPPFVLPPVTPLNEELTEEPVIPYTGDDLVVNGYGMAPKLVANTDQCEIPEQVVLYYALSLASRERGEVGGMAAAEIFALSKQYLADAIARDIGNSRHEYTWETV